MAKAWKAIIATFIAALGPFSLGYQLPYTSEALLDLQSDVVDSSIHLSDAQGTFSVRCFFITSSIYSILIWRMHSYIWRVLVRQGCLQCCWYVAIQERDPVFSVLPVHWSRGHLKTSWSGFEITTYTVESRLEKIMLIISSRRVHFVNERSIP